MSLSTGDIRLYYPVTWPDINSTGTSIGGTGNASSLVNTSVTGVFPTGSSGLVGGSTYTRYAKLFFIHKGSSADPLTNPLIYLTNLSATNQITIAPDPYWLNVHASQTGGSIGRSILPSGLATGNFTGYTYETPMNLSSIKGSTVTLTTGNQIGVWVKMDIQPGLPSNTDNTFSLAIRGEVSS